MEFNEARMDFTNDLEKKLIQAAEYGKMLLDENECLKIQMDNMCKSTDQRLEKSEQDRYRLQVKLEQKVSMENWYLEEISHLKQQLSEGQRNLRESLEADKQQEVSKLTRQIDELRTDIDQTSNIEAQLRQNIKELEELLNDQMNQTKTSNESRSSEEVTFFQEEVALLHNEVTSLKSQLIDKKMEIGTIMAELEHFRAKVAARDEELEDIKCQYISLSNSLETVRIEKMDLKCQIDSLTMETSTHRKKGNSLFAELEDRRVEAEHRLVNLQASNEELKEKYQVERQQSTKYKRHISQLLLQMSSGMIDYEYVTSLQLKLSQARQEISTLLEEKSLLQEKQNCQARTALEMCKESTRDCDYVQYLITLIDSKEQELQRTQQELKGKSLQLLDEKSRCLSQNARMIDLQMEKERLRSSNINIYTKLEELQLKYEPDSLKNSGVLVVKRTERIPLEDCNEVKLMETSALSDKSTMNQSVSSRQPQGDKTSVKPLHEKDENVPDKSPLCKYLKKQAKTVTISNDVEEHKIETEAVKDGVADERTKGKGRTITAVKHIASDSTKTVNECKSQ